MTRYIVDAKVAIELAARKVRIALSDHYRQNPEAIAPAPP